MKISRREFLKIMGLSSVALTSPGLFSFNSLFAGDKKSDLVVAEGTNPAQMVELAIKELGGMERFINKGKTVVVKPNIAWARTPEQAANTNPLVVKEIVKLCYQAGAGKVVVMDHPCDDYRMSYDMSGIKKAAEEVDAIVKPADKKNYYEKVNIPKGKILKEAEILKEILNCDTLINVPVAKVHGGAIVTFSMKNLMGTVWNRGDFHRKGLHQCIADLSTYIKPQLIILDATKVLTTRGPQGPGKVATLNKIIAGVDPVAIDSYGSLLLDKKANEIPHIANAFQMNLGQMNLEKVNIKEMKIDEETVLNNLISFKPLEILRDVLS